MTIGERIKEIRKRKGMTQGELAEKIETTPQNVSQYERGIRNPKYKTLSKIAAALDVPVTDLGVEVTDYLYYPVELFSGLSEKDVGDILKKLDEEFGKVSQEERTANTKRYEDYVIRIINEYLTSMNEDGQTRVLNYTRDLAKIPEYQKDQDEE